MRDGLVVPTLISQALETTMHLGIVTMTAVVLGSAACASTPGEKAEPAASAIRAAEVVGATSTPDAALHLRLAKEELEHAQHLPNSDDRGRVDRLLKRSQVDAELALALARSEVERTEAQNAIDEVTKLNASARP